MSAFAKGAIDSFMKAVLNASQGGSWKNIIEGVTYYLYAEHDNYFRSRMLVRAAEKLFGVLRLSERDTYRALELRTWIRYLNAVYL